MLQTKVLWVPVPPNVYSQCLTFLSFATNRKKMLILFVCSFNTVILPAFVLLVQVYSQFYK